MRVLWLSLWCAAAGCFNSNCDTIPGACGPEVVPDLSQAHDLGCNGSGDLAGTPRQICGVPDFSFSPTLCTCVGDP